MSSSNLVEVTIIEETVYGETPLVGDFKTVRFTSESLSGTPDTTESQQIRTDRMSSGQVVTGLTVGGDINVEIAKDDALDDMLEGAMQSDWVSSSPVTEDLEINVVAKTITRSAGDFNGQVRVGDVIKLTGFSNSGNNVEIMVSSIDSPTIITCVIPESMVNEVGSGTEFQVSDYLEIGTVKKSYSMMKRFFDLSSKAINYRGQVVSDMELNVAYGEIVNGTISFSGNDYDPVENAADFMTDGRTVLDPGTSNALNGSVDMPFIGSSIVGVLSNSTFCIQNVNVSLANNLVTQNCIGKAAPDNYSLGTAQIGVSISTYLADQNWTLLGKKLSQEPFSVGFQIKNADGWYAFFMPAVQVSFDDPQSQGQNQDVILSMDGTAKVGANGESALRIYRS